MTLSGMYGMVSISFGYQFFVHTELVAGVGDQHARCTSSATRSNSENLDNNSGGVLLIWDHFVWIVSGRVPGLAIRYGYVHPRRSDNPFVVAYEDFWQMIKEVWRWQCR